METTKIDYLNDYYTGYDEESRLLSQHGQVEFLTTMRFVERYLRPGMRVLEIGADTGRYSHTLARRGFKVDAVELIGHNIDVFRQNTQPGEDVSIRQGNAVDLSGFESGLYDVTLLLGPMYHLYTKEDKSAALSEAVRVTRSGGVIFAAYCMADPSIISYGFIRGMLPRLLERGMLDPVTFATHSDPSDLFELHRREDIDGLRSSLPVEQLHFVSADGFTNYMRDTVDGMDEETFKLYLRYHMSVCERPDMCGLSHHTLDIMRKLEI